MEIKREVKFEITLSGDEAQLLRNALSWLRDEESLESDLVSLLESLGDLT